MPIFDIKTTLQELVRPNNSNFWKCSHFAWFDCPRIVYCTFLCSSSDHFISFMSLFSLIYVPLHSKCLNRWDLFSSLYFQAVSPPVPDHELTPTRTTGHTAAFNFAIWIVDRRKLMWVSRLPPCSFEGLKPVTHTKSINRSWQYHDE